MSQLKNCISGVLNCEKGVTYENLKHNELWKPIRKMKRILTMEVTFDNSIQRGLKKGVIELMMKAKKPWQVARGLQEIQNAVSEN